MVKDLDLPCHLLLLLLDNCTINGLHCSRRDVSIWSELVVICDPSFETQSVKFAGRGL